MDYFYYLYAIFVLFVIIALCFAIYFENKELEKTIDSYSKAIESSTECKEFIDVRQNQYPVWRPALYNSSTITILFIFFYYFFNFYQTNKIHNLKNILFHSFIIFVISLISSSAWNRALVQHFIRTPYDLLNGN